MDLQRQIDHLKEENKNFKNELNNEKKKYKVLRSNDHTHRVGTSRTSKFEHKQRIKQILNILNSDLKTCNLNFDSIVIKNADPNEDTAFSLKFLTDSASVAEVSNVITTAKADVDKCIYFKDKITIADHKYHAFKNGMELKMQMASLKAIRKRKAEISNFIEINEFSDGYYIKPTKLIKIRIVKFLTALNNETLLRNKKIQIKLSCDGTQLSRNVTIINFVFSIINEGKKASTASGNYRIGAFRILKENYEAIKPWLPALYEQIKLFKEFKYSKTKNILLENFEYEEFRVASDFDEQNSYSFEIEYLFSADMKMILLVLGLKSASSNSPCFLCEVISDEKKNLTLNSIGIV